MAETRQKFAAGTMESRLTEGKTSSLVQSDDLEGAFVEVFRLVMKMAYHGLHEVLILGLSQLVDQLDGKSTNCHKLVRRRASPVRSTCSPEVILALVPHGPFAHGMCRPSP